MILVIKFPNLILKVPTIYILGYTPNQMGYCYFSPDLGQLHDSKPSKVPFTPYLKNDVTDDEIGHFSTMKISCLIAYFEALWFLNWPLFLQLPLVGLFIHWMSRIPSSNRNEEVHKSLLLMEESPHAYFCSLIVVVYVFYHPSSDGYLYMCVCMYTSIYIYKRFPSLNSSNLSSLAYLAIN